jgi:predicted ATPase
MSERIGEVNLYYNDAPMDCCGLAEGYGFHLKVPTGKKLERKKLQRNPKTFLLEQVGTGYYDDEYRYPTVEDQKLRFRKLEEWARECGRSCVVVSLASEQENAIAAAKEEGWQEVFKFYNDNSGNTVHIFAKDLN